MIALRIRDLHIVDSEWVGHLYRKTLTGAGKIRYTNTRTGLNRTFYNGAEDCGLEFLDLKVRR